MLSETFALCNAVRLRRRSPLYDLGIYETGEILFRALNTRFAFLFLSFAAHFKDVKGSYDGLYTLHGVVFGALFLIYFSTYLYRRLRKGKSDEATA